MFNSELALRKGRLCRAIWDGDEMAGYIGFMMVDDEAHMTTIATSPSFQRRGVATTMIVDGIRTLRRRHQAPLARGGGEQRAGSGPVPSFRVRPGRRAQELLPVTGQDALVMWVHDIDSAAYTLRLEELSAPGLAVENGRPR